MLIASQANLYISILGQDELYNAPIHSSVFSSRIYHIRTLDSLAQVPSPTPGHCPTNLITPGHSPLILLPPNVFTTLPSIF